MIANVRHRPALFWQRTEFVHVFLPVLTVERYQGDTFDACSIYATAIDANPVWMRTRYVERLDPTLAAKIVPCDACVELVAGQCLFTLQKSKCRTGHFQVLVTAHSAYAAIAFTESQVSRRIHFKTDIPAMTAAFMHNHYSIPDFCHTTIMLFAGMAYRRTRDKPLLVANRSRSAISRMPIAGSRVRND